MKHPTQYTGAEIEAALSAAELVAMELPPANAMAVRAVIDIARCYHCKVIRVRDIMKGLAS